jgi:hypothetical protein
MVAVLEDIDAEEATTSSHRSPVKPPGHRQGLDVCEFLQTGGVPDSKKKKKMCV